MKKFKDILNRIGKIISSAIFIVLMMIIVLIVIYLVRVKLLANNDKLGEVRTNFYTIVSQSMYPTIEAGDIVITYRNDNNNYNVGDIITFVSTSSVSNGVIITHKVVEVVSLNGEYFYRTKGDNNSTPDPTLVDSKNVIGKVIFRVPKAGFIQQFLVTKTGWIVAIVLPCCGIIIYDILKMFRVMSKKKKKQLPENDQTKRAREQLKEVLDYEEEEL